MTTTQIPEGYMRDAQGRLIPIDSIKPVDQARDQLVLDIIEKAFKLAIRVRAFKNAVLRDIEAFVQLSAEEYGVKVGGQKGNVTLASYDGQFKVLRAIDERVEFDERLQAAKEVIDDCIRSWSTDANANLRALVSDAFNVDKKGRINTARVLGLRRLKITDPQWIKAMEMISDSVQVASSKAYIRIYRRIDDSDRYEQIPLDVSST